MLTAYAANQRLDSSPRAIELQVNRIDAFCLGQGIRDIGSTRILTTVGNVGYGMYDVGVGQMAPFFPHTSAFTVVKASGLPGDPSDPYYLSPTQQAIMLASTAVSAYHGYKRNHESTGYAVLWGVCGMLFPVITPIIAVVEGYAKPIGSSRANPSRRRRARSRR